MTTREIASIVTQLLRPGELRPGELDRFISGTSAQRKMVALLAIDRQWAALRQVVSEDPEWVIAANEISAELAAQKGNEAD